MAFEPGLVVAFVAVAEEKSFTRAAALLGMAQPQISLKIRKLENQLGAPLFVRNTRRVELTREGEQFLGPAAAIVRALDQAQTVAASFKARERLRMGTVEVANGSRLRNNVVNALLDRHPAIALEIVTRDSISLCERLGRGELDVLLLFTPPGKTIPGLTIEPLQHAVGYVCMPCESPLARYTIVPQEALAGQTFVLSPGKCCPDVVSALQRQMALLGINVVTSPDTYRSTILHMADMRRLNVLDWVIELENGAASPSVIPAGMTRRPIAGNPFGIQLAAVHKKDSPNAPVRRFLSVAREFADVRHYADQIPYASPSVSALPAA